MIIACILERKAALTLAGTNTIENIKERYFPILASVASNLKEKKNETFIYIHLIH